MTADRPDIVSRHDIVRLVDTFYDRVRADDILAPIFDEVARVDWAGHLPKMYAFWDAVLFGTAGSRVAHRHRHAASHHRGPGPLRLRLSRAAQSST